MKAQAEHLYHTILTDICVPSLGNAVTYQSDLKRFGTLMLGFPLPVLAADALADARLAIVNLDGSQEPGSHWVGIYDDLFYDSFGRRNAIGLRDTELDAEQSEMEDNCGARVMAWLILCQYWGTGFGQFI